jgi:glycosyltransferase involved in cell wall biosynthesis
VNVLVFIPYRYDTAPGQRFRIEQWASALASAGVRFRFVPFQSERLYRVVHARGRAAEKAVELLRGVGRRLRFLAGMGREWDVVFLYREMAPFGPPVLERLLAAKGVPIVYDFDDAVYLPDVSEANRAFARWKWVSKVATICRLATHVTVGNPHLTEWARPYARAVTMVPTTIDTDSYKPKEHADITGRAIVGWSGSLSTIKHLRTIEGALRRLRQSVDFELHVVGDRRYTAPGLDVQSKDWTAQTEVSDLRSFDVGIMPLPDDEWARGKCGLKALQYMGVGVPTVVSAVGVNADIVDDGQNGFIAKSEDEWVGKLHHLLVDEQLRTRFARAGRRTVEERYSAKVQAPRFHDLLNSVRRRQ